MGNDLIIVASTTIYYTSSFSSEYLVTELLIIFLYWGNIKGAVARRKSGTVWLFFSFFEISYNKQSVST